MDTMSLPALGNLRLAAPADVLRIGIVAACGFRYSPVFDWERPYHSQFPQDTLLSYRQEFEPVIRSPEHAVLVAIDRYRADEASKSKAVIPPDDGYVPPPEGEDVVVGVACWKIEPGSKRQGSFQNDTGEYPNLSPNKNRDKDLNHVRQLSDAVDAAEQNMDMVVVHPAYWGHGHGSRLVKWGMALADADGLKQGVMAAMMGITLYSKLGWKNLSEVRLDGDDVVPQGVSVAVMEYDGTSRMALPGQPEL